MAKIAPSFNLGPLIEKKRLTANWSNYADWVRALRIVLRNAKREYVLDGPLPEALADNASEAEIDAYTLKSDTAISVQCLMLTCMEPELQKKFDQTPAYDMIVAFKAMYQTQAKTERYEITKALWSCHMAEGGSVSEHVIKMFGYGTRLEALGFPIPAELSIDLVLASLPPSYSGFIMNYNMNGLEKTPNGFLQC